VLRCASGNHRVDFNNYAFLSAAVFWIGKSDGYKHMILRNFWVCIKSILLSFFCGIQPWMPILSRCQYCYITGNKTETVVP